MSFLVTSGGSMRLAVFNVSSVVTDAEVAAMCAGVQYQVAYHFKKWWGPGVSITVVPRGGQPPSGYAWLGIFDTSDQAGALGYHDLTSEGLPIGKVFAKDDIKYGAHVSITFSHEVLELLGDPYIFLSAQVTDTDIYAYEACDPCEADELAYTVTPLVNGVRTPVLVSDFVTPAYFIPALKTVPGVKFDYAGHITQPLQLPKGGYQSIGRATSGGIQWTQASNFAEGEPHPTDPDDRGRAVPARAHHLEMRGSRSERRHRGRHHWQLSTVKPA